MLKTNSKIVNKRLDAYILECMGDYLEENEINITDAAGACKYLYNDFMRVHGYEFQRGRAVSASDVFFEYMGGLPFHFDFRNFRYGEDGARAVLAAMLEQTETQAARVSYEDSERLLSNLIFKRVMKYAREV